MSTIVIFVEEPSAEIVVSDLAARLIPAAETKVVPHSGKTDLKSSFPRTIRAWRHPPDTFFIVLQDNDGAKCLDLKRSLVDLIPASHRSRCLVRIVVQELEAWYLGDLHALAKAGLISADKAARLSRKKKFRDPDLMTNAKQEFMKLHDQVGQRHLARLIAPHLNTDENKSISFQTFANTLRKLSDPRWTARLWK